MSFPSNLETLEDAIRWVYNHDGKVNELWRQQHETNVKVESKLTAFSIRLGAVEQRIMWVTGVAATFGSIVGAFAVKLLG